MHAAQGGVRVPAVGWDDVVASAVCAKGAKGAVCITETDRAAGGFAAAAGTDCVTVLDAQPASVKTRMAKSIGFMFSFFSYVTIYTDTRTLSLYGIYVIIH